MATGTPMPRMAAEEIASGRRGPASPAPVFNRQPVLEPLRAGATDDNANLADFTAFLDDAFRSGKRANAEKIDVRERRTITVVDSDGKVVPMANVSVTGNGTRWSATTYGDGGTPFFPNIASASKKMIVRASAGSAVGGATWDGASDLTVKLEGPRAKINDVKLDVVFLVDTTGSMQDEIDRIESSLLDVTNRVRSLQKEFSLRYGARVRPSWSSW